MSSCEPSDSEEEWYRKWEIREYRREQGIPETPPTPYIQFSRGQANSVSSGEPGPACPSTPSAGGFANLLENRFSFVAARFKRLIENLWRIQVIRNRFAAYGEYLKGFEQTGRGALLDRLSNSYPADNGRKPKHLRDRSRSPLVYTAFDTVDFWGERGENDVPVVGTSSREWESAD